MTSLKSTIVLTKEMVITCTKCIGATSVRANKERHVVKILKAPVEIYQANMKAQKNIYINLSGSHDNLGDEYFDPASSYEIPENSHLILSKFKRQL